MPDPVPAVPAAQPAASSPPSGMEAALHLLGSLAPPEKPAPAATPAAPAAPPAAQPETPASRSFAIQARKERALLDQQRALKAQQEELRAQAAEIDRVKADLDARMRAAGESEQQRQARRAEYLRNPRLVLEDAGLTLEQLAEAVMRDGQPDPALLAQSVEQRLQQVSQGVDEKLKALAEAEAQRERRAEEAGRAAAKQEQEDAIAQVRADIAEVVQAAPEKYELIGLFGDDAQRLVYRAIETHYNETGKILSYEDACGRVETYLDGEVEKIGKTKRYGGRFKPKDEPKVPAAAPGHPAAPPVTLGNAGQAPTTPGRRPKTEEERYAEALAALGQAKF